MERTNTTVIAAFTAIALATPAIFADPDGKEIQDAKKERD